MAAQSISLEIIMGSSLVAISSSSSLMLKVFEGRNKGMFSSAESPFELFIYTFFLLTFLYFKLTKVRCESNTTCFHGSFTERVLLLLFDQIIESAFPGCCFSLH